MRRSLSNYLLKVHELLRDQSRDRGVRPGSPFERDLQAVAAEQWLHSERRVRCGPHGGVYYSGLTPETDLFVYDGPAFLHIEAKDWSSLLSRSIVTEFWARALDLHLGLSKDALPSSRMDHYPVLVTGAGATDELRAACIRWGVWLLEPQRIPLVALRSDEDFIADSMRDSGCSIQDLRWACLPLRGRFPRSYGGISVPFGPVRSGRVVRSLLRFQQLATTATFAHRRELHRRSNGGPPQSAMSSR